MLFQTSTFYVVALVKNHYSTSCYLNAQLLSQSEGLKSNKLIWQDLKTNPNEKHMMTVRCAMFRSMHLLDRKVRLLWFRPCDLLSTPL